MKKAKEQASVPFWSEILEHIHQRFLAKKGRKYPFVGQEFRMLKQLSQYFSGPELMAMYDVYLTNSPFWGKQTGYLVEGMWKERSLLLDDARFKSLVHYYEGRLGFGNAEDIVKKLGATVKTL